MKKFSAIKKFIRSHYHIDVDWEHILSWIADHKKWDNLELNPDFQRGYVWTRKQQISYVEHILKNGLTGREIYFNCPDWMASFEGPMVCVDGLQRITAVQAFMGNKIKAFGTYRKEYIDSFVPLYAAFSININNLVNRSDILQWYIDLNTTGKRHTPKQIEKVKNLLDKERA